MSFEASPVGTESLAEIPEAGRVRLSAIWLSVFDWFRSREALEWSVFVLANMCCKPNTLSEACVPRQIIPRDSAAQGGGMLQTGAFSKAHGLTCESGSMATVDEPVSWPSLSVWVWPSSLSSNAFVFIRDGRGDVLWACAGGAAAGLRLSLPTSAKAT